MSGGEGELNSIKLQLLLYDEIDSLKKGGDWQDLHVGLEPAHTANSVPVSLILQEITPGLYYKQIQSSLPKTHPLMSHISGISR